MIMGGTFLAFSGMVDSSIGTGSLEGVESGSSASTSTIMIYLASIVAIDIG